MREKGGNWLMMVLIFVWIGTIYLVYYSTIKERLNPTKTRAKEFERPIDRETLNRALKVIKRQ